MDTNYSNPDFSSGKKAKGNGNKVILIIIALLLLMLVLLFGYYLFFYEKNGDNTTNNQESNNNVVNKSDDNETGENNTNEQEEVVKDLSLDDPTVKALADKVIGVYTNTYASKYSDYFYKKDKIILADEDLNFKLSLAAETISDQFKSDDSGYDCNNGICAISYIDEESIKDAYHSLFGNSTTYSRNSFQLSGCGSLSDYTWSSTNNRYERKVPDGCGGTTCGGTASKLAYAKQITSSALDKIEIYEYFYYDDASDVCMNWPNGVTKLYSDYNRTNLIDSYTGTMTKDEIVSKYKDRLGQYKYTFVKDSNGTYGFTSVEKVK